jgi:hypothetical protein
MAIPMHARRAESLAISVGNGDAEAKSNVPKRLAAIMNVPSPQASIKPSVHPPVANPGKQVMPPSTKSVVPVM